MRLRHLRIRVNTDKGLHGTDIGFPDGLLVIWADNSMGKSTCLRSIIVALGFEAMITSSQQDLPLPPAMKAVIESDRGQAKVIESDIYLEIENKTGDRIVIHRSVKGTRSKDLVTVTFGPALSQPSGSYRSDDFFVSRPGSASREHGFHRMLAAFLGWSLPTVQTFDGHEYPLYMQCIFPYFFVDQTRGWSSIDPPIPSQFRIREPHKRTVEFLLNLDANYIANRRIQLAQEAAALEAEWSIVVSRAGVTARSIGGVVNKLPLKPVTSWPPEIFPNILVPNEDNWISAEDLLTRMRARLKELVTQEIPRVSEVVQTSESELAAGQEELNQREAVLARLLESLEMERGEAGGISDRLGKIEEDLQRNKDVKTLLMLGSTTAPSIAKQICPTCHQHMIDSLIPLAEEQSPMSIDNNISFLEEQRSTFQSVLKNVKAVVDARENQTTKLREEIASLRNHIRALKQTLVSDGRLPSKAAIQAQIEMQQQAERIASALDDFSMGLSEFENLAHRWAVVETEKQKLPADDTSSEDRQKLSLWSTNFTEQLSQYGFLSLEPNDITISFDTYRPTHQGFDLPTNISASDLIRVIWSYLSGLLELSRTSTTNHPGLLIFDEPKQQSTRDMSFAELLKRASQASRFNQQVIFATSQERRSLKNMLVDIKHEYIEFDGRILRPIIQ